MTATGSNGAIGGCDMGGGTGSWWPGPLEAGSGKWPMTLFTLARIEQDEKTSSQRTARTQNLAEVWLKYLKVSM
jgi:hypothetical protein